MSLLWIGGRSLKHSFNRRGEYEKPAFAGPNHNLPGTTVLTLSGSQERDTKQDTKNRFIGAWRLAWLEEPDAAGAVHKADCTGLLVNTRDGHMSVQVMYRNPQTGGKVDRFNMRKAAMKHHLALIKSTRAHALSFFMSKGPWCATSSAKIFRVPTNSLETSCS